MSKKEKTKDLPPPPQTPAEKLVAILNEALTVDRAATSSLMSIRVPCNEEMALHPDFRKIHSGNASFVGVVGLLNALARQEGKVIEIITLGGSSTISRFEIKDIR